MQFAIGVVVGVFGILLALKFLPKLLLFTSLKSWWKRSSKLLLATQLTLIWVTACLVYVWFQKYEADKRADRFYQSLSTNFDLRPVAPDQLREHLK